MDTTGRSIFTPSNTNIFEPPSPQDAQREVEQDRSNRRVRAREEETEHELPSFHALTQQTSAASFSSPALPLVRDRNSQSLPGQPSGLPSFQGINGPVHKQARHAGSMAAPQPQGLSQPFVFGGGLALLQQQNPGLWGSSSSSAIHPPSRGFPDLPAGPSALSSSSHAEAAARRAAAMEQHSSSSSSSAVVNQQARLDHKRQDAAPVEREIALTDGRGRINKHAGRVAPALAQVQAPGLSPAEVSAAARLKVNTDKITRKIAGALRQGQNDEEIYKLIDEDRFWGGRKIKHQAFTGEFLTAVLLGLPQLDDAQVKTVGKAVGRCRGWASRYYSPETKSAIESALMHPQVAASVPVSRLIRFLKAADETGPTNKGRNGDIFSRRHFTIHGPDSIPRTLCNALLTQARAPGADVEVAVATARQLGNMLNPGQNKAQMLEAALRAIEQFDDFNELTKERIRSALEAGHRDENDEDFEALQAPLRAMQPGPIPAAGGDADQEQERAQEQTE